MPLAHQVNLFTSLRALNLSEKNEAMQITKNRFQIGHKDDSDSGKC